jgi:4a-hydroxytetrahydrobiopterin dehydratase
LRPRRCLHARFVIRDFGAGVRFLSAIGEAGKAAGHYPEVRMGTAYVDLKLISDDAIYRDDAGTEHQVEWVTQQDVDLARRISEIAAEHSLSADPRSITTIELALDTANAAALAPLWAALLTGGAEAQGRGTIGDDCATPRAGCRSCGSKKPILTRHRVRGSTSMYRSRTTLPSNASPPQWPLER